MSDNNNFDVEFNTEVKTEKLSSFNQKKTVFAIEGGGTKGVYAIGVLKYLFGVNPHLDLKSVDIFGGTSVGSYLATALSLGCDSVDLLDLAKIINISNVIDSKLAFPLTAYRFLRRDHLYDDSGRKQIIRQILNQRIDKIRLDLNSNPEEQILDGATANLDGFDLTFGHLDLLVKSKPETYKDLIVNVVDISRGVQLFMTNLEEKWHHIKISDAILASSAIPFVFESSRLFYDAGTDSYSYQKSVNSTENYLIDGGVSTNNPLDYFLIHNEDYEKYQFWLLQFTMKDAYKDVSSKISFGKQLLSYLIDKSDEKTQVLNRFYKINHINLNSKAGTLEMYTQAEIMQIIQDIYQKCLQNQILINSFI